MSETPLEFFVKMFKKIYPMILAVFVVELIVVALMFTEFPLTQVFLVIIAVVWFTLFFFFIITATRFHSIGVKGIMEKPIEVVFNVLSEGEKEKAYKRIRIYFEKDELIVKAYQRNIRAFKIVVDVLTNVFQLEVRARTEKGCIERLVEVVYALQQNAREFHADFRIVSTKPIKYTKELVEIK